MVVEFPSMATIVPRLLSKLGDAESDKAMGGQDGGHGFFSVGGEHN